MRVHGDGHDNRASADGIWERMENHHILSASSSAPAESDPPQHVQKRAEDKLRDTRRPVRGKPGWKGRVRRQLCFCGVSTEVGDSKNAAAAQHSTCSQQRPRPDAPPGSRALVDSQFHTQGDTRPQLAGRAPTFQIDHRQDGDARPNREGCPRERKKNGQT